MLLGFINHYLPHVSSIAFSHLPKSRHLLLVGKWGGKVMAVQVPGEKEARMTEKSEKYPPVGGEMLKPQLLSTGNWLPSLAKVIKLWTLDQVLHKHLFAYLIYM